MSKNIARREFIKRVGAGTGVLGMASSGAMMPALSPEQNPPAQEELDWQQIDADHEEKIQAFLDNIGSDDSFWRKPLEYTMDGDVKVFELTVSHVEWETEPGRVFSAFAYNGLVPGPEFRVTEGDRVRIVVHNELNQSTAIHWHGIDVPSDQDGVAFLNQPPITPGETYVYEFICVQFWFAHVPLAS